MLAGLFSSAGSTVQGALSGASSAIGGVWKGITSGIGNFTSNFFPAAQKVTTVPAITAPAGGVPNAGYRANILPQMASIGEAWIKTGPTGQLTSTEMAAAAGESWINAGSGIFGVAPPSGGLQSTLDKLFEGMKKTAENATTFKSLADSIMGVFKKHEPITEGPDGTVVTNIDPEADMSSSVGTYLTGVNQALSNMVKGLFNLGYSGPQGAQPTVPVQGEFAKTTDYSSLVIIAAIVIGLILFLRKK